MDKSVPDIESADLRDNELTFSAYCLVKESGSFVNGKALFVIN